MSLSRRHHHRLGSRSWGRAAARGLATRGSRAAPVLLTASILTATACQSGDDPPPEAVTVVDSAGIQIVTIHRPAAEFEPYATLDSQPSLTIGRVEGDEPDAFGSVQQVTGFLDGSMLIADGRRRSVVQFSGTGEYVRTWGREGEGPGEYQRTPLIVHAGPDSVWLWDIRLRRVSVFDSAGGFGRMVQMAIPGGRVSAVFEDGALLVESFAAGARGEGVPIMVRGRTVLLRVPSDGAGQDTTVSVPGEELGWGRLSMPDGSSMAALLRSPFARTATVILAGSSIVGGPNDRFELNWWSPDGTLRRVSRFRGGDRLLSAGEVSELRTMRERLAGERMEHPDLIAQAERAFDPPDWVPAFSTILVDPGGNPWVGELPLALDRLDPTRWWVFDAATGVPRGYVDTPEGFDVEWVGDGYVLGTVTDELGVDFVQRYDFR